MLTKERGLWIYRKMNEIRNFEESAWNLYCSNKVYGSVHLYIGEEAVAASVCSFMDADDKITSTHRGHGHCIAKGGTLKDTLSEMMGREAGYCKGRGGSMHIADFSSGNLGANGTVGGGVPISVGAALAQKYRQEPHFTVCFFGDGASNQGVVHESMNLASLWKLPLIFVCENNGYALSTSVERGCSVDSIAKRAVGYNMPGYTVDGNDAVAISECMETALAHIHAGEGPVLIECLTTRWKGHWTGDPQNYRPKEDIENCQNNCPIQRLKAYLLANKLATAQELETIETQVRQEMQEAIDYATNCPYPDPLRVTEGVFYEGGDKE